VQLIEEARQFGLEKFVAVGTICAYPKFTTVPFREEELWHGHPVETNVPYSLAKKMLLAQAQAYREQSDFNAIYLLPINLYGPGHHFDPESSHVIPALIQKCVEARDAGEPSLSVWSDGSPSREFLYVDDAAQGIVLATERYESPEPANVGAGFETAIRDLVHLFAERCGFRGRIEFDPATPNGQPRRFLDVSRTERAFGFRATTDFATSLSSTIDWHDTVRRPQLLSEGNLVPVAHA
jgi:GDP-L-fucose synthase